MARLPPITVPGALYVQSPLNIIGNARVLGVDQCGGASLPGVTTTLDADTVTVSNNATVTGSASPTGDSPERLGERPGFERPGNDRYPGRAAPITRIMWFPPPRRG